MNRSHAPNARRRFTIASLVVAMVTVGSLSTLTAPAAAGYSTGASTGSLATLSASPSSTFYARGSTDEVLAYNRVIRLEHQPGGTGNGTLIGTFEHATRDHTPSNYLIRDSSDDGATWSTIATVTDPLTGTGHPSDQMWQPFLFEFPSTLGAYGAGTLVLMGVIAPSDNLSTTLVQWRSVDGGNTWSYVNVIETGGGSPHGIWEPFVGLNSSGDLLVYFSDERDLSHSQKISHVASTDGGQTWGTEVDDIADSNWSARPGMPTVAVTGSGLYVMAYEICGTLDCQVWYQTSIDGETWTTGATHAVSTDTRGFKHSPFITWSPAGGPEGELLLTAQDEDSSTRSEQGHIILVNVLGSNGSIGAENWHWLPTPFATEGVPDGHTCAVNYSPNLLVSESGETVRVTTTSATGPYGCSEVTGEVNAGVLPYSSSFPTDDDGWIDYPAGSCWSDSGGIYSETCGGGKAIAGSTGWSDYTLQGDVRIDSGSQAGFLVRASNPSVGTDNVNGYYVAIWNTGTGYVFLGRENGGSYTGLASTGISISNSTWYHITVQAIGCTFTVSAVAVGSTATPASFTYTDTGCTYTTGAIGLRDYASPASWRNVTATAGGTTSTATATYYAPFAGGTASGWTTYGGTWPSPTGEVYSNTSGGTGDKSVAGSTSWANYSVTGDVQLGSATGGAPNAGLLARVANPTTGTDALDGYFAGITPTQLILGKESYGWTPLQVTDMPVPLAAGAWYHITLEVVGCEITMTGVPVAGGSQVTASATDTGCFTTGAIGVRTYQSDAAWRNVAVTPRT